MNRSTPPRTFALILIGACLVSGVNHDSVVAAESRFAGRPLLEALRDLQADGLEIFYTSNLVRPDMMVVREPVGTTPRTLLSELLEPHGLRLVDGPGGRLVVVAGPPKPGRLRGRVHERGTRRPLAGVQVLIPGTANAAASGVDGRFELVRVEPGPQHVEARRPGYVVARLDAVTVSEGSVTDLLIEMDPAPVAIDEIVVTPSRVSLLREDPISGLDLDREDILALPHFGDDIFRALTLLPGVTGQEASAQFNVRGGRDDEVLVLLDRVELFEPYHLKDYSSSVSIVTPRALREVSLVTGGFSAQFGDRMSGVLDMKTEQPSQRKMHLGLGVINAEVGGAGSFGKGQGHWLGSVRRGFLDLTLDFLGQKEQPRFWDAFGKAQYQLTPNQQVGIHVLDSDDTLDFFNIDPDAVEDYLTSYGNAYTWLTHQAILGPRLFVDSAVSRGRVERDRRGREAELEPGNEGEGFTLFDHRQLDVVGVKQDWMWQASERRYLQWGFEVRRLTTDYDYRNDRALDDPLEGARALPREGLTAFTGRLRGDQASAYVSERRRFGSDVTLELGLRYDEMALTRDRDVSPRFNLVVALGNASVLRAAWGLFHQTQRPYELQVEDGITALASAERTEQRVLGFEHTFGPGGRGGRRAPILLRVEAYHREIRNPRARFENILEPRSIFPEIEADRVLIAPRRSEAYGIEVFLRGQFSPRIAWWAGYTYARTKDRIDNDVLPRGFDQPHAFNLDVDFKIGPQWRLNVAWRYHSGWPTTAISGRLEVDDEGEEEIVTVLGPIYAERLSAYHRMDLRASREWKKKRGVLGFFLEIQNLYNRENLAGADVDVEVAERPDGTNRLTNSTKVWGGILPSFGVTWDF